LSQIIRRSACERFRLLFIYGMLRDRLGSLKTVRAISDEMRLAVEALWPELVYKLPPKKIA
jgi:hypothetical protein